MWGETAIIKGYLSNGMKTSQSGSFLKYIKEILMKFLNNVRDEVPISCPQSFPFCDMVISIEFLANGFPWQFSKNPGCYQRTAFQKLTSRPQG